VDEESKKAKQIFLMWLLIFVMVIVIVIVVLLSFAGNVLRGLCGATGC
jgi:hypothetical protein